MGKPSSRGRTPASKRSLAREVNGARGFATIEQGDLGEAAFVYKAVSLHLVVAKPCSQNQRYDFMVDAGSRLWRVQVKTCTHMCHGLYLTRMSWHSHRVMVSYTESDCDFVAAYIIPEKTWYILPVRAVVGHTTLSFRPKGYRLRDPYAYYREAWHLLREPDGLTFG
jgi:hypothetical protein